MVNSRHWILLANAIIWSSLVLGGLTLHSALKLPLVLMPIWMIPPMVYLNRCDRMSNGRLLEFVLIWLPAISTLIFVAGFISSEWRALFMFGTMILMSYVASMVHRLWFRDANPQWQEQKKVDGFNMPPSGGV